MTDLLSYADAATERNIGMQRAEDRADRDSPGWPERAYDYLVEYARKHEFFISEDVSMASIADGFEQPVNSRAWGSAYRKALKNDVIIQDGSGRSLRRHASICPRWRSLVFADVAR